MIRGSSERPSTSDLQRRRASTLEVLPGVVALVLAQGSLLLLDPDGGASTANLLWCLLPLGPVAWLMWAQVRSLRRADEYQRIGQLEAMAIGFAAMFLAALVGGLLQGAGIGDPAQSLQITFIGGTLAWVLASMIKAR